MDADAVPGPAAPVTTTPPADAPVVPPLPAALLVAAGGTVGVLARALLGQAVATAPDGWPWVTLGINVAGSCALGVLLAVLQRGPDVGRRRAVRLAVGTGVLGGFTTYSTFALDVVGLVEGGRVAAGVAYALVSVTAGVGAAVVGLVLGARVRRPGAVARAGGAA
ncbi:fluoride efflux transporter FluC [Cellulomonas wangsupingiae]|uniref:Fluoride-specific ion channel FluC n=1 Tax=Cellulomonas wangsupingiae TaxID=2968085 RepID=A0ABY5K7L9_9CELL|nr:CrcB family protein [Cellulomonas wangsupingiae]MCC2334911.1 CrcB family protein [Cellulomonas wangsupingiae]UUI65411.1 CrcB family protein [Cellulomonas wangsupingiae]